MGPPLLRWTTALLSRATGVLTRLPIPRPLRAPVLGLVAGLLRIDRSEAARPVAEYRSVGALFTRELVPGVRRWPESPEVPGSPVDGVVGRSGRIAAGRLLQAKGREYTVAELLDDERLAERFAAGSYVTIYLSPRHYHRIHAPVGGLLGRARHIPGRLLPVNRPATRLVDRLFPRNERLVTVLRDTPVGEVAVVAVGAFNVGRISAAFDGELVTNRRGARAETRFYDPPVGVARGEELMTFHLGSTVVVLFDRPVEPVVGEPGRELRLGERITGH